MSKIFRYESEAAMCAAFIDLAKHFGWTAYPETCGYDIVLVDEKTGMQIAVEAKQSFNIHVLDQITERIGSRWQQAHPDFYAVLVPEGGTKGLGLLAKRLGVTIIRAVGLPEKPGRNWTSVKTETSSYGTHAFRSMIPDLRQGGFGFDTGEWLDHWPSMRLELPDYIPDVAAGKSSPLKLTSWKIAAIKICILLEYRGWVCSRDFKEIGISMSMWSQGWLAKGDIRGKWIACENTPDYRQQHKTNYQQIADDFDIWAKDFKDRQTPTDQGQLL